jgi:hypothetical protein
MLQVQMVYAYFILIKYATLLVCKSQRDLHLVI